MPTEKAPNEKDQSDKLTREKQRPCYCGSGQTFDTCCYPLLQGSKKADTPEQLMRSRYTAYATQTYPYILDTYARPQRQTFTLASLKESDLGTRWLKLQVIDSSQTAKTGTVTFKAWYQVNGDFYLMHECSSFVLEDDEWRYTTGEIQADSGLIKLGRNDICLCGSGKKFKKCCGN